VLAFVAALATGATGLLLIRLLASG
jgi:hypothetical protein